MSSAEEPGGIRDLWEPTVVHELTDKHMVCVLGVEMRVRRCRPANRGGDFYILEAAEDRGGLLGGGTSGLVTIEVDRNRLVHARLTDRASQSH